MPAPPGPCGGAPGSGTARLGGRPPGASPGFARPARRPCTSTVLASSGGFHGKRCQVRSCPVAFDGADIERPGSHCPRRRLRREGGGRGRLSGSIRWRSRWGSGGAEPCFHQGLGRPWLPSVLRGGIASDKVLGSLDPGRAARQILPLEPWTEKRRASRRTPSSRRHRAGRAAIGSGRYACRIESLLVLPQGQRDGGDLARQGQPGQVRLGAGR